MKQRKTPGPDLRETRADLKRPSKRDDEMEEAREAVRTAQKLGGRNAEKLTRKFGK